MFLHMSVILFTGGVFQHALQVVSPHASQQVSSGRGVVSQHALQVSRPTPKGETEGSIQGGSPGPHPEGCLLLRGVPAPGGVCSQGGVETPRDDYCCGRYASYWNAF